MMLISFIAFLNLFLPFRYWPYSLGQNIIETAVVELLVSIAFFAVIPVFPPKLEN